MSAKLSFVSKSNENKVYFIIFSGDWAQVCSSFSSTLQPESHTSSVWRKYICCGPPPVQCIFCSTHDWWVDIQSYRERWPSHYHPSETWLAMIYKLAPFMTSTQVWIWQQHLRRRCWSGTWRGQELQYLSQQTMLKVVYMQSVKQDWPPTLVFCTYNQLSSTESNQTQPGVLSAR